MGFAAGVVVDGRYELRRLICEGAASELYEARHAHTDRTVTVQVLTDDARHDAEQVDNLLAEAASRTKARHRYVVAVLDAGRMDNGDPYLVTEMDEGRTMDGLLASRGTLTAAEALPVVLAICEALACAHARGVIHGSLSSASILLPAPTFDPWTIESGEPPPAAKLLDMGRTPRPTYSAVGGPLGGFGYTPSEQLLGGEPDARCDIYSLGAVLYECLSGQLPPADGVPKALGAVLHRAAVPTELADIVLATLATRDERTASMMALLGALRQVATAEPPAKTEPPPRRRRTPRASYVTPVHLAQRGQERTQWLSQDVSEGGMLIVGPRSVSTGEKVHIRFALPRSGQDATLTAMVRWVRPAKDEKAAVGVEFIGPPSAMVEDIREYVAFFTQQRADE
ncbi:MAG: PilZ domain-containing protein [Deltaproteobacteria bacterium]|jgi:serine/threonine protein kinase|nr:PilZ domain-containing protein [Deltaproteobacteria bacterium]MBW2531138.1 PilZ domain-containing protein [Deltaproteobacteria bacterium]